MKYNHGEPWWNDTDRRKLICPPEFSGSPTRSHLVAKQEELEKEMTEFCLMKYFFSYFEGFFSML
jgi:hypothetical protein